MVGKGSVNHNSRKFKAENVDGERSHLNVDYCNESIKKVYHKLFDEALQRYNEKQTRADRRIADYYEKIRNSKQEKPFHELILQIGDKENMNAMPPHHSGKVFFFGLYPLAPLRIATGAAFESLRRQRLLQRYPCIKSTLAASRERDKVNVQMRRCFIHMDMSGKYKEVRISFLESMIIFIQNLPCKLSVLTSCTHIFFIPNL